MHFACGFLLRKRCTLMRSARVFKCTLIMQWLHRFGATHSIPYLPDRHKTYKNHYNPVFLHILLWHAICFTFSCFCPSGSRAILINCKINAQKQRVMALPDIAIPCLLRLKSCFRTLAVVKESQENKLADKDQSITTTNITDQLIKGVLICL